MEVDGLRDIFKRSKATYGVRYTTFVGDGDSASHSTIAEEKPYGPDVITEKKECRPCPEKARNVTKKAEVKVGN